MKTNTLFRTIAKSLIVCLPVMMTACSNDDNDDDENNDPEEETPTYTTENFTFDNVESSLLATDIYGANYYEGSENQVTKGYIGEIGDTDVYAQFPVNASGDYGTWAYNFWNGGIALSNFTDKTDPTYMNQMSVYGTGGFSGKNFAVVNGTANIDKLGTYADYDRCGHVYLTDEQGYGLVDGEGPVKGEARKGTFESVMVANTTYAYLVMQDGNEYSQALQPQNGWFKVQFIAFDSTDATAEPLGVVETYLANFDSGLNNVAGLDNALLAGWQFVDLTPLGEAGVLVINLIGSDLGEWGLNTPAYCAIDDLKVRAFEVDE